MNNANDNHYVTPDERKALDADNVPEFFMHFAIAGHVLDRAWIDGILEAQAWRILDMALQELDEFSGGISHESFVIMCCKDSRIPSKRAQDLSSWQNRSSRVSLKKLKTTMEKMRLPVRFCVKR